MNWQRAISRRNFVRAVVAMIGAESGAGRAMAFSPAQDVARSKPELTSVKALVFDTFGTVVDWRASVTQEVEQLAKKKGFKVDAAKFADAWRAGYGPSMNRVRTGELPWTKLDALHRMILDKLLIDFGIAGLSEAEIDALNHAWHRLRPWPDAVSGLTRLKKRFIIAPLSNGNISLMTNLAKYGGLPVGLHPRSGARAALQARPRGLSIRGRYPRPEGRRRHDGGGSPWRSAGGEEGRTEDGVRPAASRVRPARQA